MPRPKGVHAYCVKQMSVPEEEKDFTGPGRMLETSRSENERPSGSQNLAQDGVKLEKTMGRASSGLALRKTLHIGVNLID